MKTETQKKRISTIGQLREIRDKISAETRDMTFEQFKAFVEQRLTETLHPNATWQNKGSVYPNLGTT
jgi:hypothetical protein